MRLFNDKKGQEVTTSKVFYWLVGLVVAVWLVFSIWGFGATFFNSLSTTPHQLTEDLFVSRITNTCFAWTEQTTSQLAEVHPSIIDLSKVTDTRLSECFTGEDILPLATVDVRALPTATNSFSSQRAILINVDTTLLPAQLIQGKQAFPFQERYVLVKDITRTQVCGLRKDAIKEANKENDYLFNVPVLLTENDFKAIETCIAKLTANPGTQLNPAPPCGLSLSMDASKYNPDPRLTDFCYSKVGPCTYQDFEADYKGTCQIDTIEGKLIPAELKVTFYE